MSDHPWFQNLTLPLRKLRDLDCLAGALVHHEQSTDFHRGKIRTSLATMRRLNRLLLDPLSSIPVLHVAGSKGKGSVCLLLEAPPREQGFRTGLYLSPHVERWVERIRISSRPVKVHQMLGWVEQVLVRCRREKKPPTFFEALTAAAFLAFRAEGVDLAVVETGIGGRLDATNVVKPTVTIVTAIEREHTAILGSSLCEIAREKAGIFKRGVPALSGVPHSNDSAGVLRQAARRIGAPLWQWGKEVKLQSRADHLRLTLPKRPTLSLVTPSGGPFAGRNAALAVAALHLLARSRPELEVSLEEKRLNRGLRRSKLLGRCEQVGDRPALYRDGAHTPKSLAATTRWIARRHNDGPLVLILGMQEDKAYLACLRAVRPWIGPLVATPVPASRRSRSPRDLVQAARALGMEAHAKPDLEEALKKAKGLAGKHGSILVAGSFWLAGLVPCKRG